MIRQSSMIKIDQELLDRTCEKASLSPRLRINYNFHTDATDTLHRMLNAMKKDTYIQPHKHENPDKREAFILLKGALVIVEFDQEGNIIDSLVLDKSKGNLGG